MLATYMCFCSAMTSCLLVAAGPPEELLVASTAPSTNASNVAVASPIVIHFDRAVQAASVIPGTFSAFGRWSGAVTGDYVLSDGDHTVTLVPDRVFSAGESVMVVLSHDILASDGSTLRSAGYSFQFTTRSRPAAMDWAEVQVMSNVTSGQTRIYGAAASDLNGDGWLDLTTVNEVSADLRVFMNLGDGQGTYSDVLTPPLAIGVEASPNETGDFNGDGRADLAVAASVDDELWIALGNGDGTYAAPGQAIAVGNEPHGVAVLDVDGDGDVDVVTANRASNDLALLLNDGNGVFGAPTFFDGGVDGEYGLIAGDMDGDAILDLVVAGRDGQQVRTLLGNGDGTFVATAPQDSGGATWVVVLTDVDGDGELDAATANSFSQNGAILLGNGDGTFAAPAIMSIGAHCVSTDLGDLDGDGDADWVLSSFGGGFWRVFLNDGSGTFTFVHDFTAAANPSCSVVLDIDNDRDLDLALTDEIADLVTIQKNSGTALFGDFDNDATVGTADYDAFAACFSGPGVEAGLACGSGDFDGDGDVDCADWDDFNAAWNAGGAPPDLPHCANGQVPAVGAGALVTMAVLLLVAAVLLLRRRSGGAQCRLSQGLAG